MIMIGDVLKKKVGLLSSATNKKNSKDAFWVILRNIACEEIIVHGEPIDSDIIIPLYYAILLENIDYIPKYFQQILPSNGQERFRVIVRNLFSSNAFHLDGLANQKGIQAYKEVNESKKGKRIVFMASKEGYHDY